MPHLKSRLPLNLSNKQFGSLRVLRRNGAIDGFETYLCHCACGAMLTIRGGKILDGTIVSCQSTPCPHALDACAPAELNAWKGMLQRKARVCLRWKRSFAQFLSDLGPQPPGAVLSCPASPATYLPLTKSGRASQRLPCYGPTTTRWIAPSPRKPRPIPPVRFVPPLSMSELARMVGATHWHERPSNSLSSVL